MNGKKLLKNLVGFFWFFLPVTLSVSIAVVTYGTLRDHTQASAGMIAVVMLIIILVISLICACIEFLRHRWTVERRVQEILDATQAMAAGDFTVRLPIAHSFSAYDDFDKIKENLNVLSEELSKMELLHSDFISSVSHEIKTPLAVIKSYATALLKGGRDETTVERYAKTLVEASEKLTTLVTNILKLNRLENSTILPESKRIDASELLAECIIAHEDAIERKGLGLECDIEEGVFLTAPEGYFEIICNNFLSNAIKFTEGGGTISVSLKTEGSCLILVFADTGCGISPTEGERIFDKFYQADTSHASEGNGLGLALVKKVIDRMGGEISVDSMVGKGSTFTVKLGRGE